MEDGVKISFGLTMDAHLNSIKRQIYNQITKKLQSRISSFGDILCRAFVRYLKKKILEVDNDPISGPAEGSHAKLRQLARGVGYVKKDDSNYQIILKDNNEHLLMYLEYGTGFIGLENPHPDAQKDGWNYAINRDEYPQRPFGDGLHFVFYKYGKDYRPYIAKSDITPIEFHSVKKYHRKKTNEDVEYRYEYTYKQYVMSKGLRAMAFLYRTKQKFNKIIKHSKTLKELRRNIKEME